MICSTIIPTIGRPSLLRAVESVLEQNFDKDEFEIIVVNDSGNPLASAKWMESPQVKILHTNRQNRSVARNTGAAIAQGKYFHFLDDDDWILPDAFQYLLEQAENAGQAGWIYGGFRLVNDAGEMLKEIRPEEKGNCFIQMISSEWIPIQASWINSKAFFEVGGFAPLDSLDGGFEDIDLSRLVASYYDFRRCEEIVAVIRYGDTSSTTDYNNLVKQNRRSREKNLELSGAFSRMKTSARDTKNLSIYWRGKIIYYYLVSLVWNLKQKYFLDAASRLTFAFWALVTYIPHWVKLEFWRGILTPHHNLVRKSLAGMDRKIYTKTLWER
jgi:glycosyltransferase involved in cell wall biosynthesis